MRDGKGIMSHPSNPPNSDRLAIEVSNLTLRFGSFTAVDHIALRVLYGEIFGLLGANGAGKSTMIKMLTTLLEPTSGSATFLKWFPPTERSRGTRIFCFRPGSMACPGKKGPPGSTKRSDSWD